MGDLFPDVSDDATFDAVARDEAKIGPGVDAVCDALGLARTRTRFSTGSVLVYAVGDGQQVLKIFPPQDGAHFATEEAYLRGVHGRLPVATP